MKRITELGNHIIQLRGIYAGIRGLDYNLEKSLERLEELYETKIKEAFEASPLGTEPKVFVPSESLKQDLLPL